jgi:hypothetical protein
MPLRTPPLAMQPTPRQLICGEATAPVAIGHKVFRWPRGLPYRLSPAEQCVHPMLVKSLEDNPLGLDLRISLPRVVQYSGPVIRQRVTGREIRRGFHLFQLIRIIQPVRIWGSPGTTSLCVRKGEPHQTSVVVGEQLPSVTNLRYPAFHTIASNPNQEESSP